MSKPAAPMPTPAELYAAVRPFCTPTELRAIAVAFALWHEQREAADWRAEDSDAAIFWRARLAELNHPAKPTKILQEPADG